MGSASSSIVINLPSPASPSSSEPVIDDKSSPSSSSPSSSSSSGPVIDNVSSPSSSLSTGDPLVDGITKTFVCISGCKNKFEEMDRVCNPERDTVTPPAATDAEPCAKAVAALHKCVRGRVTVYEGYDRYTDKQQEDRTDE